MAFSASAAGVSSSAGSKVGLLPTIGDVEALRRGDAGQRTPICVGAVVIAIAFTPARLSAADLAGHVLVGRLDLLLDDGHAVLLGERLGALQAVLAVLALEVDVADLVALLEHALSIR